MIDALRQRARELGLAAIGIAPATDEVTRAFGWARSVVCVAISYLPPGQEPPDDAPRGLVARFARSADYHLVLREKLARLAEVITREHPAARAEICVDTNPLPERKLAVLAGIAWRGKNGCVFVEGCGSWVALGEIVTSAPIQSGVEPPQSKDLCGDCTRCIDACPTRAIIAPHEIDRGRCISALTQAGGEIAPDLRTAMGNRIYGCDICQEVCPQNAGVEPVTPEFAIDVFPGAYPELMPLVDLTAEGFREYVAGSSIGWIRRSRIRRNASIAAENLSSEVER
jgi:epoxyqueuosine reductase